MADICLILEGTYPYITGGVSTFIHNYIKASPNLSYIIVHIGADAKSPREYKYEIPENVHAIHDLFLFNDDIHFNEKIINSKIKCNLNIFEKFYNSKNINEKVELFTEIHSEILNIQNNNFDLRQLLGHKYFWRLLTDLYSSLDEEPSFIDFFYTSRYTLLPILELYMFNIPHARIYHSLSTGYAGFLATLAGKKFDRPFFVSEHGIYTNERDLEISHADWIYEDETSFLITEKQSFFKNWWNSQFDFLAKIAYKNASEITTIYNGNKTKQINNGAPSDKIIVIPNGINIKAYQKRQNPIGLKSFEKGRKVSIALVGRVVPIKDIKTFIKAISILSQKTNNFEVLIIGPFDEDIEYYEECLQLTENLNLSHVIKYTGKVNVKEYYDKIDILTLTSVSEGLPLVVLEAFANYIPCVLTDVGACKELIYGNTFEDNFIGQAGFINQIADASGIANSYLELINDKSKITNFGSAGFTRLEKFYQEHDSINKYSELYYKYLQRM